MVSNDTAVCSWVRQDTRRKRSRSVYSEGPVLYSWGDHYPMAVFHTGTDGVRYVLINADGYSSSTRKHLSIVRRRVREFPVIEVDYPLAKDHERNLQALVRNYRDTVPKFRRARTQKGWHVGQLAAIKERLVHYCTVFGLVPPPLLPGAERERLLVELLAYKMAA